MGAQPLFQKEVVVLDLENGLILPKIRLYLQDHPPTSKDLSFKN